ncbi:phosphatidylglycerol lysyltransferase domain-containing protein [Ferrimicrobium sp.]|uniref:bifunctional lysylphosphatidylglycerol flippase/synthetase MprF n=1 Tax=Ferrimicrobium sp. TaxID=2926050 RepID=UPI0026347E07|nr:phosphatidylglycerol lysyltransferase domain-containing protein [Ferrimicrobium sp.]
MGTTYHLRPGQRAIVLSSAVLDQPQTIDDEYHQATDGLSDEDVVIICGPISHNASTHLSLFMDLLQRHHRSYLVAPQTDVDRLRQSVGFAGDAEGELQLCSRLDLTYDDHGTQHILVDPGQGQPTDPRDTILARLSQQGSRFRDADKLHPQASLARYIASRSFYRRLRALVLWTTIPLVIILAIRIPILLAIPLLRRQSALITNTELVAMAIVLDVVLAVTVSFFTSRGTLRILDTPLDSALRTLDPNASERLRFDEFTKHGYHGMISAATRTKELITTSNGIFASPGTFSTTVIRLPTRLPIPALYVAATDTSWLEIEPGATLRINLWSLQRLVAPSRLLRLLAAKDLHQPKPRLLASIPGGPSYSPVVQDNLRSPSLPFRRVSAIVVFLGGLTELATSLIPPLHSHFRLVSTLFPNLALFIRSYANAITTAAGVGMIAVALGLHAGRRRSFQITVAVGFVAFLANLARGGDLPTLIVLGVVLAILLLNRRAFDQPTPARPSLTRLGRIVVTTLLLWIVADSATIVAHLLFRRQELYRIVPTFGQIIAVSIGVSTHAPLPFNHPYLRDAMQLAMVVLLLITIWTVIAPLSTYVHLDSRSDLSVTALSQILSSHPQGTLDYFVLRDDKLHWVRHGVVIAYGIFGSTIIVSPDPIGPRSNAPQAFIEFFTEMKRLGRSIAVLGASAEWQRIYHNLNMRSYYIGDEALVTLANLDLAGKRHKSLRQAVNRMKKYGYSVSLINPLQLAEQDRRQILAIMASSRRGDHERGFSMTLGRVFDPRDNDLLMSVCRNADATITGFCQWVPAPAVHGYSLDLMRRDLGEHPNGMFDLLIVETIRQLNDQGYQTLSLNFAAMRAVLAGERGSGIPSRVERWVLGRLSDSMQIESLWHFNAKFEPTWLPRYLVVDSIENVPAIAIAAGKAESLWDLPVIGRFLNNSPSTEEHVASST